MELIFHKSRLNSDTIN